MFKGMHDTIAALSTPMGVGALSVIRLTGPESFEIVDKLFHGKTCVKKMTHASAQFGSIIDPENQCEKIDDVILTKFIAPRSFTGEDVVEISCHGGLYIVQEILQRLFSKGARPAEPGEFCQRAFINGKMDLVQAEAIADIIHAQTKASLSLSSSLLKGELSKNLRQIAERLRKQCALLELELDFSEEDVEFADRKDILQNVDNLLIDVKKITRSFRYGRLIREGVHTVIVGKPNVGKSSLLNRLLKEDRAIVTEIPGTTRDSLEESIDIRGVLFRVTDTAGLRKSKDVIEQAGIARTETLLNIADIVLYIIDVSQHNFQSDVDNLLSYLKQKKSVIIVFNKIDKMVSDSAENVMVDFPRVKLSAKTGEGFERLEEALLEFVNKEKYGDGQVITKTRHRDVLQKTAHFLQNARESLLESLATEFIAADLRAALDTLGELTGEVSSEDLLNDIFSNFCIGK